MEKKEVLKICLGILIIILFLSLFIGFSILKNKENLKEEDINQDNFNKENIQKKNYTDDINKEDKIGEINESYVIRSFSSSTVAPGNPVDVSLDVYINVDFETSEDGDAFAIVVENLSLLTPSGWEITNYGYGTESSGELGWFFFSTNPYNPLDSHYQIIYTMQAPLTTGNYNFQGYYIFSTSTDSDGEPIIGPTTITVD